MSMFEEDYKTVIEYMNNGEAQDLLPKWATWELADFIIELVERLEELGYDPS